LLARALVDRGHVVELVVSPAERRRRASRRLRAGLTIVTTAGLGHPALTRWGVDPLEVASQLHLVGSGMWQVVHSFGHRPAVLLAAQRLQRKGVVWLADWADWWGFGGLADHRSSLGRAFVGSWDHMLERFSRRQSDGLTVVSQYLADLAQGWGIEAWRVLRIGGGADVDGIRPAEKFESRLQWGLPPNAQFVGYSGLSAFDREHALRAFDRIAAISPGVRFLLIGGDDPWDLARRMGPSAGNRIHRLGYVQPAALGSALACADVMLLPLADRASNRARFPNRLGDYLAAGRPVITNPTGEIGRIVTDNRLGRVVEESSEAMAKAAFDLLAHPDELEILGSNARAYAEKHLSWAALAARIDGHYSRLIASGGVGSEPS
jgi:glycosyltransferase involved in cell wall biosynthesis